MKSRCHVNCHENCTWRAMVLILAVGMPNSFEPRPKPLTTSPFRCQTGCRGTTPQTVSSKFGSPYCSGLKSNRLGNSSTQPVRDRLNLMSWACLRARWGRMQRIRFAVHCVAISCFPVCACYTAFACSNLRQLIALFISKLDRERTRFPAW